MDSTIDPKRSAFAAIDASRYQVIRLGEGFEYLTSLRSKLVTRRSMVTHPH